MKFYIETYGCQMNISDSELISTILTDAGHTPVISIDEAELFIFNTCSVRQHAEDRVLGRISNEKVRKQSNPDLKIAVVGCMAQRLGDSLLKPGSGIDIVIGVDQYTHLPELIEGQIGLSHNT
ncbi:MAG TPA: tRNA (N6-isopentenyl adenosine(37)-C2)-methylthiotransferase MiaB, partial [Candidatus Cloacimonadota bacterium]|nr:tRNA (N6-isopentenyl adenosine(37)-C2)-methylthiotransferase MiaB [Candidatus Cloacimonadota bacterium]